MLYHVILYYNYSFIILNYFILYYINLYNIISYHFISYHIILYYIILHYITLYYIILYYIILYTYPITRGLYTCAQHGDVILTPRFFFTSQQLRQCEPSSNPATQTSPKIINQAGFLVMSPFLHDLHTHGAETKGRTP